MSASGPELKQSDIFSDVYGDFFDRWLRGMDPVALAREIYADYADEFDEDDVTVMPDVCFALCLALWECGAADDGLLARTEHFMPLDVEFWKSNGEPGLWRRRERVLQKLREKLSVPKAKPRKPKTGRVYKPSLHKGDVIAYWSGGLECGLVVLEVYDRECWRALIAVAQRCARQQMTKEEILASPIRCLCWFGKKDIPSRGNRTLLGNIHAETDFNGRAGATWSKDGGFSSGNMGGYGYIELNVTYLQSELQALKQRHGLMECTVGDLFVPGAPVLPESWK